jgi:hypothetical protein
MKKRDSKSRIRARVLLRARNAALEAALKNWDALIRHQYTGSRWAMSDMYVCAQETAALLYGDRPWPNVIAPLEKQAARIEELEAALKDARDKALVEGSEIAFRLNGMPRSEIAQAFRAALEKKND